MQIVKDFVEQGYNNNNGKPWKSCRIFRVGKIVFPIVSFPLFFLFLFFFFNLLFLLPLFLLITPGTAHAARWWPLGSSGPPHWQTRLEEGKGNHKWRSKRCKTSGSNVVCRATGQTVNGALAIGPLCERNWARGQSISVSTCLRWIVHSRFFFRHMSPPVLGGRGIVVIESGVRLEVPRALFPGGGHEPRIHQSLTSCDCSLHVGEYVRRLRGQVEHLVTFRSHELCWSGVNSSSYYTADDNTSPWELLALNHRELAREGMGLGWEEGGWGGGGRREASGIATLTDRADWSFTRSCQPLSHWSPWQVRHKWQLRAETRAPAAQVSREIVFSFYKKSALWQRW